jgi:Ubiquitin family
MSTNAPISVTVTHRGTPYSLSLLPDSSLAALQILLEELTSVPPSLQKLLYKGKKLSSGADNETTLSQAGFKNGIKIQMLGSTAEELGNLQAAESDQKRRDRILRERAVKAPTKVMVYIPITPCG